MYLAQGKSDTWTTDIYSDEERQDAYEMVGWIADQPWYSGKVGMISKSYSAVVQWQVKFQNIPALKAIIVRYSEWDCPDGYLRPYMFDGYSVNMNTWNFTPPDLNVIGEQWEELWQDRLEQNAPWEIGYISNPLQESY